jgi:hypothetical protein
VSALDEYEHAIHLVEEVIATGNTAGLSALLEIDDVCTFDSGDGQCRKPIEIVVILMDEDTQHGRQVHAATYCRHHAELAEKAVKAVRARIEDASKIKA